MVLVHPWMLLGLLLVPAAVLLHVYRVPGRRHEVSWLPLWRKVLAGVHPEAAERTRRLNWLLLVEILIISLLVLALAGPTVLHERPRRHVAFIVNTSASMNAVDADGTSRWEKARSRIDLILDRLDAQDVVSLCAGPAPTVAASGITPAEARRALDGIRPADVPLDAERLLSDAEVFLGNDPDAVFQVSDSVLGGEDPDGRVRNVIVGGPSRNAGIVAFDVTRGEDGAYEAFVRIGNGSADPAKRTMVVTDASSEVRRIAVEIAPRKGAERVIPVRLTPASPTLAIRLEGEADGLAADDEVRAVRSPVPVIVTGSKPGSAYSRLFGGKVFEDVLYLEMDRAPAEAPPEDALLIVRGEFPTKLARTSVIVDPPQGNILNITVGEESSVDASQISIAASGAHEILQNVDVGGVSVLKFRPLDVPSGATPLLRSGTHVIAAMLDTPRARVIILSFDPEAGRWPLTPSFVVFWANVLADARRRSDSGGVRFHRTGEVVQLPAGEQGARVNTPSGVVEVSPGPGGWAPLALDRVGLCVVEGTSRSFAVNLLSEAASRSSVRAERMEDALPEPRSRAGATSLAPWLCVLAGCFAAVWWLFRR